MMRPARIGGSIDVGRTILIFAAEDSSGPLQIRIVRTAWEDLRMVPPYLDDEDRRDAALFELELLCTDLRIRRINGARVVDVTTADVDTIVCRITPSIER